MNPPNVLEWKTSFQSTLFSFGELIPNLYNVSVGFDCLSSDICIQNIGFERIRFMFRNLIDHSVIANKQDKQIKKLVSMLPENTWLLLPGDANDQLLLWCLYHKLSAILGEHFSIHHMTIDSSYGDNVIFTYDGTPVSEANDSGTELNHQWEVEPGTIIPHWWARNDLSLYDSVVKTADGLQAYIGPSTWEDVGLKWITMKDISQKEKKAKIIKPKRFKLKVVDGDGTKPQSPAKV